MKIKVTGTKTDFAVGEEIVCDTIPAHLVNKCVVIDDSALEVATPGVDGNGGDDEDEEVYDHIENQHDGIIPSHYNPVAALVEVEQAKPKRGRPAKQAE